MVSGNGEPHINVFFFFFSGVKSHFICLGVKSSWFQNMLVPNTEIYPSEISTLFEIYQP